MRVAHNITAFNAWRQLNNISGSLAKSVERLSSGYRINKAADDPAGLVISETLRAQIIGMDQAMNNTQDGISMIQTAEGALSEMHSLLDSMRSLALHAANTAASTSEAIAADQEQLDSAVDSINRIASYTAYAGKGLLDGSAGNAGTIIDATNIGAIQVGTTAPAGTSYLDVNVTQVATRAYVTGVDHGDGSDLITGGADLTINGEDISIASGTTVSAAADQMQLELDAALGAGVIDVQHVAGRINLQHNEWGDGYRIDINDTDAVVSTGFNSNAGQDIAGQIRQEGGSYEAATGDGLSLTANAATAYAGAKVTMTTAGNTVTAHTHAMMVVAGQLTFQIGSEQGQVETATISNMSANKLGTDNATNGLNDVKSGQTYALGTDANGALKVIDEAISDVSTQRAKLGSLQTNVLESNLRNLAISRENLQSSEARIRDVDMAQEMMEFTKNNVLTQAATAMLAQANVLPNLVLTLLG